MDFVAPHSIRDINLMRYEAIRQPAHCVSIVGRILKALQHYPSPHRHRMFPMSVNRNSEVGQARLRVEGGRARACARPGGEAFSQIPTRLLAALGATLPFGEG